MLASVYGHLGQPDLAREALAAFRGLESGDIADVTRIWFQKPELRARFLEGIALAESPGAGGDAA